MIYVGEPHIMSVTGGMPGTIESSLRLCTCTLQSECFWATSCLGKALADFGRSILPALAFSLDMFQKTGSNYGVNEVLLASVLGSIVFSLFAAQPLVIVGVTGPITVFN